jgi:hypothetical protein
MRVSFSTDNADPTASRQFSARFPKSGKDPMEIRMLKGVVTLKNRSVKEPSTKKMFMKTSISLLSAFFIVGVALAQPADTISTTPSTASLGQLVATNRSGQSFSTEEVQRQLAELHRAVAETTPALSAVLETYSNSTATTKSSAVGSIAGLLANAASTQTAGSTNLLARALNGVLTTTTNATTPTAAPPAALNDLAALQQHLNAIGPILQRLEVPTNPAPLNVGGTEDNTGTEKGQGSRDR